MTNMKVVEKSVEYRVYCPACYAMFIIFNKDDIEDSVMIGCPVCHREIRKLFIRIVRVTKEELKEKTQ